MALDHAGGMGASSAATEPDVWANSVAAACDYLNRTRHPDGHWSDFWLPVGTSDAWVTAYVGLALQAASACPALSPMRRAAAGRAAHGAAQWLLAHPHVPGGWGYNASVAPDADSTAHALSLLARLGYAAPEAARALLRAHEVPRQGFRTYVWTNTDHAWTGPRPDVTAAALRALHDLNDLDENELRRCWEATVAATRGADGAWPASWWTTHHYSTGLALEVWRLAGAPPLPRTRPGGTPTAAFDLAWVLQACVALSDRAGVARRTRALLRLQSADGGWPSVPCLRVPPALPGGARVTLVAQDARRVFTTATALRALVLAAGQIPPHRRRLPVPASTSAAGVSQLVYHAALSAGFPPSSARAARGLFSGLSRESLASPSPWPSHQLSALSGGMPLEFSVTVGPGAGPALRYATEVGDPYLSPQRRAHSGLGALERTARDLGADAAWARIQPALQLLTAPDLPVPDSLRFWVWGGIDQAVPTRAQRRPPAVLKVYLNLLHRELGDGRARLNAALKAAGIPVPDVLKCALDTLDQAGFLHELGFGLAPGGRFACKVYYELPGWNRPLVGEMLQLSGLPGSPDLLCPEIPGLLRESLASRSRAGTGLRLDTSTGTIRELMGAAAFPVPLLPLAETRRRVEAWLDTQGWDAGPYRALCAVLAPDWPDQNPGTRALHSLFTRTVSAEQTRTTLYLRPWLNPSLPGRGRRAASTHGTSPSPVDLRSL